MANTKFDVAARNQSQLVGLDTVGRFDCFVCVGPTCRKMLSTNVEPRGFRALFLLALFAGLSGSLISGCSKQSSTGSKPVVTLTADKDGSPIVHYSGPGGYQFETSLNSFTVKVGPIGGTPWISVDGDMKHTASNEFSIKIRSTTDRPYQIQLFGFATNSVEPSEDNAKESMNIESGSQELSLTRFLFFTYERDHK